jgi:hypothetical protein
MKKLLLLFALFFPNFVFGQVNIESIRNNNKEKPLWGEVKGGLELQRGNVDITSFDLDILIHFKKKKHHVFLQSKNSQGQQTDKKFKNNSFVHLRWTWMTWDIVGLELFTQLQQDEFKSLKLRQLNGGGFRAEILKRKDFSLSFGTGAMLDYEEVDEKEKSTFWRSTSYLTLIKTFDKKKKNLTLFTLYYQPLFNNPKDYRVNLEANVRTILISSWNIFVDNSINYLYDTEPPEGINTNDLIIKTNITYTW